MTSPRPAARRRAILVRDARPSDLPALARLGAGLARWHHRLDPGRFFTVDGMEQGYAWWLGKELGNRGAVVLAATRGRRVVGYAYGRIEPRDWNTLRERCGVGVDLVVAPGFRRRGLGRRLVEGLVQRLAARGAPRLLIDVAAANPRAQAAFRRMGFRPTMLEMAVESPPALLPKPKPKPKPGSGSGSGSGSRSR
jgi:ribosomal protein S18 acetylase RimI-like enzyme